MTAFIAGPVDRAFPLPQVVEFEGIHQPEDAPAV